MSHKNDQHDIFHDRKEFQLERLILFSDAVFAIAITLLIIEIKVPVLAENNTTALMDALGEKFPEFFGFILSFAVIGQFWINHHKLFGLITGYNNGLLWLNLHMLFWIVLVPFTSGLNSHYGNLNAVWMIYSFNMFMIALSLHFIYRYVSKDGSPLSTLAYAPLKRKYAHRKSMSTAIIFLIGVLLCIPNWDPASWAARLIFFLIPLVISFINKSARKAGAL